MSDLVYRRPSCSWLDRLPLGNGRIGAMVGAGVDGVRIGLNEATAWSGGPESQQRAQIRPEDARSALQRAARLMDRGQPVGAEEALRPLQHRYAQTFLPVGELAVDHLGSEPDVRTTRRLSLSEAIHSVQHETDAATLVSRTAVVHEPDALVHEVSRSVGRSDFRVRFDSPMQVERTVVDADGIALVLNVPADAAPAHEPGAPARTWELPGIHTVQVAVALRIHHDGRVRETDGALAVTGCSTLRIVLAVETTFTRVGRRPGPLADAVSRAQQRAAADVSEQTLASHAEAQRGRHAQADLTTPSSAPQVEPDALLAPDDSACLLPLMFEYGRYLLRSGSRAGQPPATLQGLWNAELQPPWSSDYTLNINTPMNYWGAEPTAESDSHLALLELLEGLAERGRDTARRLYDARGWVAHHNSDVWGYTLPTGGDASWALWPFGGAWLVRQFDEHRRFGSMTDETLDRFWPVARGAAEFFLDFVDETDGAISTFPSTSPENTYRVDGTTAALTRSSGLDLALLRELFELVPELAQAVGRPQDRVARECARSVPKIPGPRRNAAGAILEWGSDVEEADPQHRHLSPLYPWFPGHSGGDEEAAAVRRTLDLRGDDSTGWSLCWKLAIAARLGDAERIERLLPLVFRTADHDRSHRGGIYPNLFAAHPPFQIDGNLGFVAAICETLIQSHRPGRIDLLPALPGQLATGAARGLVARPGIVVDLSWSEGRLDRATLTARTPAAAGPATVTTADHSTGLDVPFGTRVALDATLHPIHP